MSTIRSLASRSGEGFEENAGAHEVLVEELRDRTREARRGSGDKAQQRHEDRGKMLARDRIDGLLDPGTAFL